MRSLIHLIRCLVFAAVTLALAVPAEAQAPSPAVRDVLSFLVTNRAVPTADFETDRAAAEATRDTIAHALLIALATLPITSSSGGFTYRFNPLLGTAERSSDSFGPFLIERALTAGREQASFGLAFRAAEFDTLDGRSLHDGGFVTVANRFTDEPAPFDREALTLRIRTRTVTAFANYGVTDWLEIGGALPFVALELEGERLNQYRGSTLLQAQGTASARGIADMAVRAKASFTADRGTGLGASLDVRLPTGRQEDLLGAGRTSARFLALASLDQGWFAVHANAGVSTGGISPETSYGGAIAAAIRPRVTVSAELLGRRLRGLQNIAEVAAPHPALREVETIRLLPQGEETAVHMAVAGVKWNVAGSWLLTGHVLWWVNSAGLTGRWMPAVALDYAFGQ